MGGGVSLMTYSAGYETTLSNKYSIQICDLTYNLTSLQSRLPAHYQGGQPYARVDFSIVLTVKED